MIDGFDTNGLVGVHLALLVPAAIAVARSVRFPTQRQLDRWLAGHHLSPDGDGPALARTYLRRTRAIRSAGFVLAFTILPLIWLWSTRSAYRFNDYPGLPALIVCFGGAVVLAELVRPHPPAGRVVASEPRTLAAYVPAFTRFDPLVMASGFGLLILWSALAAPAGTTATVAARAGGAVAAFVAARTLQWWLLTRPQRTTSLELLRVDDAIRATGATGISAVTYAVPLAVLGDTLWDLAVNDEVVAGGMGNVFALLSMVLMVAGWSFAVGFLSLTNTWAVPRLRRAAGSPTGRPNGPTGAPEPVTP